MLSGQKRGKREVGEGDLGNINILHVRVVRRIMLLNRSCHVAFFSYSWLNGAAAHPHISSGSSTQEIVVGNEAWALAHAGGGPRSKVSGWGETAAKFPAVCVSKYSTRL